MAEPRSIKVTTRAALVEAVSECLEECLRPTRLNEVPLADGSVVFIDGISEAIVDAVKAVIA